ncbi:DUF512 domain-containing protein [Pseudobutyrivibrio ruminis]|uniref:DUF512 domain-containing protein n=1 Tax=Pseudobutyrivibrio ruminis TaxID=46206 RepID=UPI0004885773|nr:DUF512 domain-containing protein [Pseudobutyrivibrio ruminis]
MLNSSHKIASVMEGSPAERAGLFPGDIITKINDVTLVDIFDYHYYSDDANITVELLHEDGTTSSVFVEKEEGEDLGVMFCNGLMDDYKSCSNKCAFCFIDQMPPGMRDTLYFKDDDTRLSFLQGNYVTLTNMKMADLDRIIAYKLGPINISVHATNPELRVKLLHNRFAGDILDKIRKLYEAEIPMNAQVVACPGLNDGEELDRTISDLLQFAPVMGSMSVVPVGITKFRDGLFPLRTYTAEEAGKVIDQIEHWQDVAMQRVGNHFVQASDEWYILAGRPLPEADRYDGFIQLENGVGMLRLLHEEVLDALEDIKKPLFMRKRHVTIATGKLAAPFMRQLADIITEKFNKVTVDVVPITNEFFGEEITVSGLITGQDLIKQLKDKNLGDNLLLSCTMLRSGEEVFLDDITLSELEETLQVKTRIVQSDGRDFVYAIIGR